MRKSIGRLTKIEKIIVAFLSLVVVITGYQAGQAFYDAHADYFPQEGGIYTEGAVGKIGLVNPLFVQMGSITHDLTTLVFSGLTRYDPDTQQIVPDVANFTLSDDNKEYTFVIKEGAVWHDGEPITSDDVLFTYNSVLKNPSFHGAILNYTDFSGMAVTKIDERTVQFLLEKPDSFFLVKTLTGLLPAHRLEHEPVELLDQALFNLFPIGSGPYKFVAMTPFPDHAEVTLEANEDFYDGRPHIGTIILKVFNDVEDLLKKKGELDGLRSIKGTQVDDILKRGRLTVHRYQLPQYVALFLNTESPILKNKTVRLALQLGTDKEDLVDAIGESRIIDTPLLEIDSENWVNQYSIKKSNGALFDTEWQIPNKEEFLEDDAEAEEEEEENTGTSEVTHITTPNEGKDWETDADRFTIAGNAPKNTKSIFINDYELNKYTPGDPAWSYVASEEFKNLKDGENVYEVYTIDFQGKRALIDAITIYKGAKKTISQEERDKVEEENAEATDLPIRQNKKGEPLTLRVIVPSQPTSYPEVAQILQEHWRKIGVGLSIEVLEAEVFQERLKTRDYDLLIFGQSLGYNLDAYPYWHSSQAKEEGFNLSQFKNFVVDSLLEKARLEHDEEERKKTLNEIQTIMATEVPAIFLYSPTYLFAQSSTVMGSSFAHLATTSDRFSNVGNWYAKVNRRLKDDVSVISFLSWIINQF